MMARDSHSHSSVRKTVHRISASTVVPVYTVSGRVSGPTVLLTGGMDGDEYAGILACREIITRYHAGNFRGRLIVIPVVNPAGLAARTSRNPEDGKFPKLLTIGNPRGSATERLIHLIHRTYVPQALSWIDLHGGAITERLHPFQWFYRTGSSVVDALAESMVSAAPADTVIFEQTRSWYRARELSRVPCLYAVFESGGLGLQDQPSVNRHSSWVTAVMGILGMVPARPIRTRPKRIYRQIREYRNRRGSFWHPMVLPGTSVPEGAVLGDIRREDGRIVTSIRARNPGLVLWRSESLAVTPEDTLVAMGWDEVSSTP